MIPPLTNANFCQMQATEKFCQAQVPEMQSVQQTPDKFSQAQAPDLQSAQQSIDKLCQALAVDVPSLHMNTEPAVSIVEFSEQPADTHLDLNFSERGTWSASQVQHDAENSQQKEIESISFVQQPEPVPEMNTVEEPAQNGGQPNTTVFDSPPSRSRTSCAARQTLPQKSRCHWTHAEIIALFDAKKAQTERAEQGIRKLKSSSSGKWDEIADYCKSFGVNKLASQCRDKWERLWPSFKKILDWEKQPLEGKSSYWAMAEDEREREGFPRLFDKELYDAMSARFGFSSLLNSSVASFNEDSGDAVLAPPSEALLDFGASSGQNGETPAVLDSGVTRTSGRKRKTPERFGSVKSPAENNKRVTILLHAKEEDGGTAQVSTRSSKDANANNDSNSQPLDIIERRLLMEERKLKLAERRLSLEEKKLEATIEIGKGLIASMEKMTGTISSLGLMPNQQQ